MHARIWKFYFYLLSFISLFGIAEVATASSLFLVNSNFPLPPRLSVNGYATDYAVGQADLMVPLAGDTAHNLYINPSLAYGSDSQGYADLGLGYRWIKNCAAILGWYVFGGYSRIDNNARIWVANPGVEALGSRWDAHLNAYFPMGDRNKIIGEGGTFEQSYRFVDHSEFLDSAYYGVRQYQHTGNGADVKLGYQFFPQSSLKGYVGSYFFAPSQTGNIWGGAVGLEYWLAPYLKVFTGYTYDNVYRSTGALGLGVEFGGTHACRCNPPTLEERITDPVERYLAGLGRGSAIPSRNSQQIFESTSSQLLFSNVAFFSSTDTPPPPPCLTIANCTFENPCGPSSFKQTGLDELGMLIPNARIYFNGGSYPATDGTSPITLRSGQSLHSRTVNYMPASGSDRSTFNGAFILTNNNTLENIILLPTPSTSGGAGVLTTNANNVLITGSQLGSSSNLFNLAVSNTGSGSTAINNSDLFSNFIAVFINGSGTSAAFTVQNSSINVISSSNTAGLASNGGSGSISISDSQINLTGVTGTSAALASQTNSTVIANNVAVSVSSSSPGSVFGLYGDSSGVLQFNNGQINVIGAAITNGHPGIHVAGSTCVLNGSSVICPP